MKKYFTTISLLILSLYLPAAEKIFDTNKVSHMEIKPPLVITANKQEEILTNARNTILITRDEIELAATNNLVDLLKLQIGIDVATTGGPGSQTSIFMRGTNSNHTLILIDGMRVNSTLTNTYNWSSLPLSQIEKIEIVRGPKAGLYGSEAIGGIIHIFTRNSDYNALSASLGSFNTKQATVNTNSANNNTNFGLTLDYVDNDGFSSQNQQGFSFDPDNDGYRNQSMTSQFKQKFSSNQALSLNVLASNEHLEFDIGKSKTTTYGLNANYLINGTNETTHQFKVSHYDEKLDVVSSLTTLSSKQYAFDYQYNKLFDHFSLVTGANALYEQGKQNNQIVPKTNFNENRNHIGGFIATILNKKNVNYDLALRYDYNEFYGDFLTGNFNINSNISDSANIGISYGKGYKNPSFNELFSPGFNGLFMGNQTLKPEESESLEMSFKYQFNSLQQLNINLFNTDIKNLIAFQGENFDAVNINQATIKGIEVAFNTSFFTWHTQFNYTHQLPRNDNKELLLRRAKNKANLIVNKKFDNGFNTRIETSYVSKRKDIGNILDSYTIANLSFNYPVTSDITINGRIENITDQEYELVHGYNTPKQSTYLGLKIKF